MKKKDLLDISNVINIVYLTAIIKNKISLLLCIIVFPLDHQQRLISYLNLKLKQAFMQAYFSDYLILKVHQSRGRFHQHVY
jgi:hypothetical protein